MTNIIIKPTARPSIEIETAQIIHPLNPSIDCDTSFVIKSVDDYELFTILTTPRNISDNNPNGCYISRIEYDPLIIGSDIMNECVVNFLTSIRYSMHFINDSLIKYKYDYLWYESDISCILEDYLEFEDIIIDTIHFKKMKIHHDKNKNKG